MRAISRIKNVPEKKADELVDGLELCCFCHEPFTECETLLPGVGVIDGYTDVKKYKGRYWHWGCIYDYEKSSS